MSKANLLGKNWNWLNIRVSSNKAETMEYFKSTGLLLISCLRMCMYVRTLASRYRASEWVTMRKFVWKFPRHDDTRTIENKWNISNSYPIPMMFRLRIGIGQTSHGVDEFFLSNWIKHMLVDFSHSRGCCIEWHLIGGWVCVFPISISYFYSHSYSLLSPYFDIFMRVCEVRLLSLYIAILSYAHTLCWTY